MEHPSREKRRHSVNGSMSKLDVDALSRLFVLPAVDQVIIYKATGLHVSIHYGAAHKLKSTFD